jgi:hypothetical protein
LIVPKTVTAGRPLTIEVGFENYGPSPVGTEARVLLHDDHGVLVGKLGPRPLTVPASGAETTTFTWPPPSLKGRTVIATAVVTRGDQVYGPARRPMAVVRPVFLPVVMLGME